MSKKDYNDINNLRKRAEELSQKPELQPYINNLDKVLGIKTVNTCKSACGIRFNVECKTFICEGCNQNPYWTRGLVLDNKTKKLYINVRNYDWYIIDKECNKDLFTIVGLRKRKKFNNTKYILGKNKKWETRLRQVIFNSINTVPHDLEDSSINELCKE